MGIIWMDVSMDMRHRHQKHATTTNDNKSTHGSGATSFRKYKDHDKGADERIQRLSQDHPDNDGNQIITVQGQNGYRYR